MCVKGMNFSSVSMIFGLDFGIVTTVGHFLFFILLAPFIMLNTLNLINFVQ